MSRSRSSGGALDGKTAGFLVKVETLSADLSQVRLFHTSVARAIAIWPTWPGEPGFTGDFDEYVAQTFPSSTAADFAVLEAGVVSEETYVEQGLYWETVHDAAARRTSSTRTSPTSRWSATRRPTSSSTSSSAWSPRSCPTAQPTRPTTTCR